MFSLSYLDLFSKQRFWSIDLQNQEKYDSLLEQGFKWIRRDDTRRFELITRRPTIGCTVEVFKVQHLGCVPIKSTQGKKIIRKLCYF
jgi:hypothetical protein